MKKDLIIKCEILSILIVRDNVLRAVDILDVLQHLLLVEPGSSVLLSVVEWKLNPELKPRKYFPLTILPTGRTVLLIRPLNLRDPGVLRGLARQCLVGHVVDGPQPQETLVWARGKVADLLHLLEEVLPATPAAEEVAHVADDGGGHGALLVRVPVGLLLKYQLSSSNAISNTFSAAEAIRVWKRVQRLQG